MNPDESTITRGDLQPGRHWWLAFWLAWSVYVVTAASRFDQAGHVQGITWIMTPVIGVLLAAQGLFGVALIGLLFGHGPIRRWWLMGYWPAVALFVIALAALFYPPFVTEPFVDDLDHHTKFKPHWAVTVPSYLAILAVVVFWPRRSLSEKQVELPTDLCSP